VLHLWHGAEIVPVEQHIPLKLRALDELEKMRDDKASLCKHLEEEMFWLQQPSDLEKRVALLEGAIAVAEGEDTFDAQERTDFLRKFVEDLCDDHHDLLALHDQGTQAEVLPHGVVLKVAEHPILTEHRAQAAEEEYLRKHPSLEERHPDIGREGLFAEQFKLVENPWNEKGWDYTKEVGGGQTAWHEGQEMIDKLVEFDNAVAETPVGQIATAIGSSIANSVPTFLKETFASDAVAPVQYGCGDVYIDKDRAKSTGRALRWQMAEAGLPVYGNAPPVTVEWLKENNVIQGSDDEEEEGGEKEEKEEKKEEGPAPKAINMGAYEPQTLVNASAVLRSAPPMTWAGGPPVTMGSMPQTRQYY